MSDFTAKMHQIRFRQGLRPRPRWGAYSAPQASYLVGRGLAATPLSALRASIFGPSCLDFRPFEPQYSAFQTSILRPPAITISPGYGVQKNTAYRYVLSGMQLI